MHTPEHYMRLALLEAHIAKKNGEIPIGAILVSPCGIITCGSNAPILNHDPTAHAEIIALRAMALTLKNYRLTDCTLYVTLQPCLMCLGAINHARLKSVYFGSYSSKSPIDYPQFTSIPLKGPILELDCSKILTEFFLHRRNRDISI